MAPAGTSHAKSKAYSHPIATQADDFKYQTKYKELKLKIGEVEDDNTKLHIKILKSKKAIHRLRIERSILYDRLQSTTTFTNPFALHTTPHLSSLPVASTSAAPPTILDTPSYPLAQPGAPEVFLQSLDAKKLAALKGGEVWGGRPVVGVAGELKAVPIEERITNGANGTRGNEGMEVDTGAV